MLKFNVGKCVCDNLPGLILLGILSMVSFTPDTLANWNCNYFLFVPGWLAFLVIFLSVVLAVFLPSVLMSFRADHPKTFAAIRRYVPVVVALVLPICLYVFRTRIHLFNGDAGGGAVLTDVTLSWRDFVPAVPYYFSATGGRLDEMGCTAFCKLATRYGWIDHLGGNAGLAAEQLFNIAVGTLDVLLACFLFRRMIWGLLVLLTLPIIHNLFGNTDAYAPVVGFAFLFAYVAKRVFEVETLKLRHVIGLGLFWLFAGYVHPLAGFSGFLVALVAGRWFNTLRLRIKIPEWLLPLCFCVVFFCVIRHMYVEKLWFGRALDLNPPIFSIETLLNWLNIGVYPVLPLAVCVLMGPAPRGGKLNLMAIYALQFACFAPATFRQGANDVFAYMICMFGVALPWLLVALKYGLPWSSWCAILACHLLVLVPLVAVHSSERTIDRAEKTYAVDNCVHNTIMSWQTHLGLKLGDNMVDSKRLIQANLHVFNQGAHHAVPEQFRGGNYLYYVAFHYHYGRFQEGRRLLEPLIRQNPQLVRNFLSLRPAFIYLNRKQLWDDLYDVFPNEVEKPKLKALLDTLRNQAQRERYCLNPPSYMKCPY